MTSGTDRASYRLASLTLLSVKERMDRARKARKARNPEQLKRERERDRDRE